MTALPETDLRWFAHRGGGNAAPENTLAAFEAGLAAGFLAFECDVKLSADGVLWLLHDDTLDRTTDAQGPAGGRTWAELKAVDAGSWHSAAYRGTPPPSLDEVLAFAAAHEAWLNLEIKPNPGEDARTGTAVALRAAAWAQAQRRAPRPLLSSFSLAALQAARNALDAAGQDLPIAYLVEEFTPQTVELARALRAEGVHTDWRQITPDVARAVQQAGLKLRAYTVNLAEDAARLFALGVDGLFTDVMDLPARVAASPG